jgi:hypothetical protein
LRNSTTGDATGDGTSLQLNGNNFTIENRESGYVAVSTSLTERLRITSDGKLGLGTSSPTHLLSLVQPGLGGTVYPIAFGNTGGVPSARIEGYKVDSSFKGELHFYTAQQAGAEVRAVTIDTLQRVGIGTTSPGAPLDVNGNIYGRNEIVSFSGTTVGGIITTSAAGRLNIKSYNATGVDRGEIIFLRNNTGGDLESARIDSFGRLLVGTSSTSAAARVMIAGGDGSRGTLNIASTSASPADGDDLGLISFNDSAHIYNNALIRAQRDGGTWTATTSKPTRLVFSTTADGASSPTERMRITSDGFILAGGTTVNAGILNSDNGVTIGGSATAGAGGYIACSRSGNTPLYVNRNTDDGDLVYFGQGGTQEGTISVSGTTVSYNGAHLSRWSQLPGGAERTEILRGSVLSNIDEMCEWGDEGNEQLNRMKVSDVEGDPNVAGVFQGWDDDDDTYTDDFYCAMTGDFIIRIAEGTLVQRGDLLMSAGDGTAKPQDDDIIRSKTIAKVTSTHVTCTYDDGSYCVPCVLMAC